MLLSEKDRSDLNKFIKYFVYKSFHVLLQSRSAKKTNDRSKLIASGSDWFNLLIRDESAFQAEVKKVYCQLGGLQVGGQPITIEFCLKVKSNVNNQNGDGAKNEDRLVVLEAWSVRMGAELDTGIKVSFGVYNRLSTLLKSLVVVSRTLPFYRVRSGAGKLDFSHSVVLGETKMRGGVEFEVGRVGTPMGTIIVSSFTNACTIQNLKRAIETSGVVTDCMLLDHFSNDFYEFDEPSLSHYSGEGSGCHGDEGEDGGDIVSVTKDDKGNVIIKNHHHHRGDDDDVKKNNNHDNGVTSTKINNVNIQNDLMNNKNKNHNINNNNNNIKNNKNIILSESRAENINNNNNNRNGYDMENNNDDFDNYENIGDDGENYDDDGGGGGGDNGGERKMVEYEDFEDVELAEFYKQFKEAEEVNIFSSKNNNKINNKNDNSNKRMNDNSKNKNNSKNNNLNNKSCRKLICDKDDTGNNYNNRADNIGDKNTNGDNNNDSYGAENGDSYGDENGDNNDDSYDMYTLSNTLAEFEANAINFDAFVQSIDG